MEEQGGGTMSLWEVDKVYQHAGCAIEEQPVHHSGVHSFMRVASQFLRAVGELESSDLWRQACVEIRRVRWLLGTVPVPLNSLQLRLQETAHSLAGISARLRQAADADLVRQLSAVAQALTRLGADTSNPLMAGVMTFLSSGRKGTPLVAVTNRFYQDAVVRAFGVIHYPVEIGLVSDLLGAEVYDSAVVVGPIGWLPPGVLNAPRAARLGLVHYDFYREPLDVQPLFDEGPVLRGTMPTRVRRRDTRTVGAPSELTGGTTPETTESLLTDLDVASLAQDAVAGLPIEALRDGATGGHEGVEARAALLADGSYVLLPVESSVHKILLVESDPDDEPSVEAVDGASISVGDYVVLRGSSYYQSLIERADVVLGDDAPMLRALQQGWKTQLGDRIAHHPDGRRGVAKDLVARGAVTTNLDYWTSSWCIRTRRRDDFAVVMAYLGRRGEAQDVWAALGRIDHAHRSAGRGYAEAVQRAVSGDLWQRLWVDRWCEIPLDDTDSGARVALVDAVLPGQLRVPPHYLCRLRTSEVP
ncbi:MULTISPECIES: hypothetical protein [Streptomyces]|uniref:hypothetical protein n=1 Tax=Streptomyces TaxID=1883 RepID=UPI0006542A5A|nr:hypothetical protein [Streptomyces sp. HNS054]WPW21399.1 hypothetical protein UBV09_23150 [Streptomyces griseoincarnatus]